MGTRIRILATGLALAVMAGGHAAAAPQILGLVATTAPMPLTCKDGVCAAEFTAFCLQEHRTMPTRGDAYRPADGTALTLTVTRADGTTRSVPVAATAAVEARREYNAVRIAVPESVIRGLGGQRGAIAVGPRASVVPVAQPDDPEPMDRGEIAWATGPFRAAVDRVLDMSSETAISARVTLRLINALPEGWTTAERRASLWRRVVDAVPGPGASAGLRRAEHEYRICRRWADSGAGEGLRRCLEEFHDGAVSSFTRKAWALSKAGS